MLQTQVFLAILLCLVCSHEAARILAICPESSRSHWAVCKALGWELASHGHQLTVMTPYVDQGPAQNWTDIYFPNDNVLRKDDENKEHNMFDAARLSNFEKPVMMLQMSLDRCDYFLSHENVKKMYFSNEQFDLILIEAFYHDCLYIFLHKFRVPVVAFAPYSGSCLTGDLVGNPCPLAYFPDPFLDFGDHMTFFQRIYNVLYALHHRISYHFYFLPKYDLMIQKHLKDSTAPSISQLRTNISLLLINNDVSLGYPRPLVPNMIDVGGLHVQPPKKLPKDLQQFLDDSKDGVIYFSMGSILKSANFDSKLVNIFLTSFSKLKQRVLWKWELESVPGKPENVKIGKWMPQNDILAHKNVKLFITHGGLLGIQESISHGVPLLGLPIFGDQVWNINRAVQVGYGLKLRHDNITVSSLDWALSELLNKESYKKTAEYVSKIFHDRPRPPLQEAVYWTEYILRHNGAPHLRTAALDLSWTEYFLLDVLSAVLGSAILFILTAVIIVKWLIRLAVGKRTANTGKNIKTD